MKKYFCILFYFLLLTVYCFAQNGKELFNSNCASCHTIGNGDMVGPDLKDAHKRHPEPWMLKWIKSSQTLIKKKDKTAVELFAKANEIVMPDQTLSDAEIKSVLAYVKEQSEMPVASAEKTINADDNKTSTTVSPQPNTETTNAEIKSDSYTNPDKLFINLGIAFIGIFFLSIVWVLSRVIITLSNELQKEHQKNKLNN